MTTTAETMVFFVSPTNASPTQDLYWEQAMAAGFFGFDDAAGQAFKVVKA